MATEKLKLAEKIEIKDESQSIDIGLQAGDCLYYNVRHPSIGKSYSEMGIPEYAQANSLFVPNISKLTSQPSDLFHQIGKIIKGYDSSQLRIFTQVMAHSAKLADYGLAFGQPVYINLSSPRIENLQAYYRAYAVSVAFIDTIIVMGDLYEDMPNSTMMTVDINSLMTTSEFKEHKKELIKAGKTKLSKAEKKIYLTPNHDHHVMSEDEYNDLQNIPTLDTVPASWFDKMEVDQEELEINLSGKKKRKRKDASDLAHEAAQGRIVKKGGSLKLDLEV